MSIYEVLGVGKVPAREKKQRAVSKTTSFLPFDMHKGHSQATTCYSCIEENRVTKCPPSF